MEQDEVTNGNNVSYEEGDERFYDEQEYENEEELKEEEEVDESIEEDMRKLLESFPRLKQQYRLVNRIGEGTFSTVYKAEDLWYDKYENEWDTFDFVKDDGRPIKRRRVTGEATRSTLPCQKKASVCCDQEDLCDQQSGSDPE